MYTKESVSQVNALLEEIKNCNYTGRELKEMIVSHFKENECLNSFIFDLDERLGYNVFGSILAFAPEVISNEINWLYPEFIDLDKIYDTYANCLNELFPVLSRKDTATVYNLLGTYLFSHLVPE